MHFASRLSTQPVHSPSALLPADDKCGPSDGQPVLAPYPPLEPLQQKRLAARRHRTTYCFDFPAVFEDALRQLWAQRAAAGEPGAVPPPGGQGKRCCGPSVCAEKAGSLARAPACGAILIALNA